MALAGRASAATKGRLRVQRRAAIAQENCLAAFNGFFLLSVKVSFEDIVRFSYFNISMNLHKLHRLAVLEKVSLKSPLATRGIKSGILFQVSIFEVSNKESGEVRNIHESTRRSTSHSVNLLVRSRSGTNSSF